MMTHKKTIPIIFFCSLLVLAMPSFAQKWNYDGLSDITGLAEINVSAGASSFLGDIGGNKGVGGSFVKDFNPKTVRPLFGASATLHLTKWAAVEAGFNFTQVNGADSLINNTGDQERWRYYRNLSFRSPIAEGYIGAVFYPTMYFEKKFELRSLVPFVGVGIGIMHYKPQTQLNGSWIDLQPLSLEGQGFPEYPDRLPYKLTSMYIPASVGVKYYVNNQTAISTGFTFRLTTTDYIDDVSTTYIDPSLFDLHLTPENAILAKQLYSRSLTPWKVKPDIEKASSSNNDSYFNFFLTLSFRLKGDDGYNDPR
jgi:hypothetical protein